MADAAQKTDPHPLDEAVCGCGDCRKAFDQELAAFQAIHKSDCIHWYVARALAASTIVRMMIALEQQNGFDRIEPHMMQLIEVMTEDAVFDEMLPQLVAILEKPEVTN